MSLPEMSERVNGILTQEFNITKNIEYLNLKTHLITNVIDIYNNQRPHLSKYKLTPVQMQKQSKSKSKSKIY